MSHAAASITAAVIALFTASWAGLLVMLQEAPGGGAGPSLSLSPSKRLELSGRVTRIGRITLLLISGFAASQALGWYYQLPRLAVGRAALAFALIYLISEGLPRSAAVLLPKLASALAPVARVTTLPFAPLVAIDRWVESLSGSILPALQVSEDRFGKEHRDMLHGVFSLGETTVSEVMTPRLDFVAVESSVDWAEVVDLLGRSDHARILVYTEDLDNVDGILFAKDMTAAVAGVSEAPTDWRQSVRPALFVPESKVLTAQLRDFQQVRSGIAVVVDEFGGTSGLITLEDVLEEIVGEIHGEYDADVGSSVKSEGEDKFWVDGRLTLDDLSEALGELIEREEVTTVGGLVYSELGRVPKPGEEFRIEGFRVVVEQIVKRRIRRVYFERLTEAAPVDSVEETEE